MTFIRPLDLLSSHLVDPQRWMAVSQHSPSVLDSVHCIMSSEPNIRTTLKPRFRPGKIQLRKILRHITSSSFHNDSLDHGFPLRLWHVSDLRRIDSVLSCNVEKAAIWSGSTQERQIVPEPCLPLNMPQIIESSSMSHVLARRDTKFAAEKRRTCPSHLASSDSVQDSGHELVYISVVCVHDCRRV